MVRLDWGWLVYGRYVIDILVVSYIFYKVMTLVQGTRVVQILKGISLMIGLWLVSDWLGLQVLQFLLSQLLIYGLLGVIIIFQPELRSALENLGRRQIFLKEREDEGFTVEWVKSLVDSVEYMSKRRMGALISIELSESLGEYGRTGTLLDARMSSELIMNIFSPNAPLHDGAVVIRGTRVSAVGCFLPLSESTRIPKELGTRHRAAIGLSEVRDALTVVVSEETGDISITKNTKMYRKLSIEELNNHLDMLLINEKEDKGRFDIRRFKLW